jgi:ferrous iron transport protein A
LSATIPLGLVGEGTKVRVKALNGGQTLSKRLTEMGINVGSELLVRQRQGGGLVVSRGELKFALGGGMAHKILVELLEDPA